MPNGSLKTLENLTDHLHTELARIAADPGVSEKAYPFLKKAVIAAINLRRDIQDARGWNIQDAREKEINKGLT